MSQNHQDDATEECQELPKQIQFLYDHRGHFIFVSKAHPPYREEELIGQPAWATLTPLNADRFQAVIFRIVNGGPPEVFDTETINVGSWRTWLQGCKIGKARIIGISRKVPEEILALTDRQRQVCKLLSDGLASKEIARQLDCARATVDNHRANIAHKVGVHPKSLVAWCGANREWF